MLLIEDAVRRLITGCAGFLTNMVQTNKTVLNRSSTQHSTMETIGADLAQLRWDRKFLQGKNHLWRYESVNPVPGTTAEVHSNAAPQLVQSERDSGVDMHNCPV